MNSPANKIRILIVDDESHARKSVRRLLEPESGKYSIDEACDYLLKPVNPSRFKMALA